MKTKFLQLSAASVVSTIFTLLPPPGLSQDCYQSHEDVCVANSNVASISVQAGTTGKALCIVLGEWEGDNPVILEWDGKYAAANIKGVQGRSNAIAVRVKQRKEPNQVYVYSGTGYVEGHQWKSCSTKMARNIQNLKWK